MFSDTRNSTFPDKCICISPIFCFQILCKHLYLYFYLDKHTHNEQSTGVLYIYTTINYKNNCTKCYISSLFNRL